MNEFKDQLDATEKEKVTKLVAELREIATKGQAGDASVTAEDVKAKIDETQNASLGLFQRCMRSVPPRARAAMPLRPRRRRRRRKRRLVLLVLVVLVVLVVLIYLDFVLIISYFLQEESDDDMGFGLFD